MYSLTFGSFLFSAPVQDETAHHCFLYFIKYFYIFRALDCDHFFLECASKNLKWSHFVSHTARVSRAEAVQKQCVCRMGRQHEREGARSGRSTTEDLVFKLK